MIELLSSIDASLRYNNPSYYTWEGQSALPVNFSRQEANMKPIRTGFVVIPIEHLLEPQVRLREGVRIVSVRTQCELDTFPESAILGGERVLVIRLEEEDGPEARVPMIQEGMRVPVISVNDVFEFKVGNTCSV